MRPIMAMVLAFFVGVSSASAEDLPTKIDESFFQIDDETALSQQGLDLRQACRRADAEGRRDCMNACFLVARLKLSGGPEAATERARKCADTYNIVQEQLAATTAPQAEETSGVSAVNSDVETPASAPADAPKTLSDPAAQLCATRQQVNQLFDCACLDENAADARAALVDKDWNNKTEKLIPYKQNQIAVARERLATEESPQRRAAFQMGIERAETEIAELQVRLDPASLQTEKVIQQISDMNVCRTGAVLKEQKIQSCKATASSLSGIEDTDGYCACMGADLAEAWTSGAIANYSSKAALRHNQEANLRCRG